MKNIYSLGAIVLVIVLLWVFGGANRANPKPRAKLAEIGLSVSSCGREFIF